jgi:hypothetical protein
LHVVEQAHDFASDIETCKHVSASLGFFVILKAESLKNPVKLIQDFTGSFALLRMTVGEACQDDIAYHIVV